MRFGQRVGLAAAVAVAEVDLLVVQRADFGVQVAAQPGALLVAFGAYFLLDYLGLCVLALALAWLRGCRPVAQPRVEQRLDQSARGKSTSSTASRPEGSCTARTRRAPGGRLVPPPRA